MSTLFIKKLRFFKNKKITAICGYQLGVFTKGIYGELLVIGLKYCIMLPKGGVLVEKIAVVINTFDFYCWLFR